MRHLRLISGKEIVARLVLHREAKAIIDVARQQQPDESVEQLAANLVASFAQSAVAPGSEWQSRVEALQISGELVLPGQGRENPFADPLRTSTYCWPPEPIEAAPAESRRGDWQMWYFDRNAVVIGAFALAAAIGYTPDALAAKSNSSSKPMLSLKSDVASVQEGGTVLLSWASSSVSSCAASGAWSGSQPTSGTYKTPALKVDSTVTVTCQSSRGKVQPEQQYRAGL